MITTRDKLYRKYAEHIANSGQTNIIEEIVYLINNLKDEEREELEELIKEIVE